MAKSLIDERSVTSNLQGGVNLLRIHFRDQIWPRTDVAGRLAVKEEARRKKWSEGGERWTKGRRHRHGVDVGGEEGGREGRRGLARVKRAAARRNSSLALIALGGLLSIMSGNRWLTQFPTARFVWPA